MFIFKDVVGVGYLVCSFKIMKNIISKLKGVTKNKKKQSSHILAHKTYNSKDISLKVWEYVLYIQWSAYLSIQ